MQSNQSENTTNANGIGRAGKTNEKGLNNFVSFSFKKETAAASKLVSALLARLRHNWKGLNRQRKKQKEKKKKKKQKWLGHLAVYPPLYVGTYKEETKISFHFYLIESQKKRGENERARSQIGNVG